MPVKRFGAARSRRAEGIEQVRRRAQRKLRHDDLPFARFDFGIDIRLLFRLGIVYEARLVGALRRFRRLQCDRFRRIRPRRDLADDLLDLYIPADVRRIPVAIDTLTRTNLRRRVARGRPRDAGKRCQMKELVKGRLVLEAP